MAQLVEQSLTTPEISGWNPDFGRILSTNCTIEKTRKKEKETGNGPSFIVCTIANVASWEQNILTVQLTVNFNFSDRTD